MKVYIDSDGVLSDFKSWLDRYLKDPVLDNDKIDKCIVDNYETCYIDAPELPGRDLWIAAIATDPDYFVLSSVGTLERFIKSNPELTQEEVNRRYYILVENKYRWFEERGIPRQKVILVHHASDKALYCKPGDILYDDYDKNIERWEEAGGIGIKICNFAKKEA